MRKITLRLSLILGVVLPASSATAAGGDFPFFCFVVDDPKVQSFSVYPDWNSPTGHTLRYYTKAAGSYSIPVELESRCRGCEHFLITGNREVAGPLGGVRQEHVKATIPVEDGYTATFAYSKSLLLRGFSRRRAQCWTY